MRRAGLLLLLALLPGCYEGWTPPSQSGTPAPPSPPSPPGPPAKALGYLLFEPITMAANAIQSDTCFPATGIRTFRSNEWTERISQLTTALGNIASTLETVPIDVDASDCTTLATVQAAAVNSTPWGSDPSPESDTSGKPLIHLKAVFWESQPATTPPAAVMATDWAAWQALEAAGRSAKSLTYFVLSDGSSGYFTTWQNAQPPAQTMSGTPINQVDPTSAGITARDSTVASDTAALVAWVQGQAQ